MSLSRARWIELLVGAQAIPLFIAFWIGGRPELGLVWAAVVLGFALALAGGRSDTIRLMRGDEDDERTLAIEFKASTFALGAVTLALAGLFLAEALSGETGLVYGLLLLLVEGAHFFALAVLNRRS